MKEKKFLDDYFAKLKDLISFDKKTINKLLETKNLSDFYKKLHSILELEIVEDNNSKAIN